jgi:hypothetical protein
VGVRIIGPVLALVLGVVVGALTDNLGEPVFWAGVALVVVLTIVVSLVLRPSAGLSRLLVLAGAVLGLVAIAVLLVDALVRGHRSPSTTLLAAVAAGLGLLLVALGVLRGTDRSPGALGVIAGVVAVLGLVAAVVLVTAVPFLPLLRGVNYDAADAGAELVLDIPAGVTDGDLLVAQVQHRGAGAVRAPEGWTSVRASAVGTDAVEVFTRPAEEGMTGPQPFGVDAPGGATGGISVFSHADGVAVRAEQAGTGPAISAPGVTTESSAAPLLYVVGASAVTDAQPAGGLDEAWRASSDGRFKGTTELLVRNAQPAGAVAPVALTAVPAPGAWAVQVLEVQPG